MGIKWGLAMNHSEKESKMKRFMSVLVGLSAAVIILLVLTGCREQVEQPAKTEPSSVEQPKQAEDPAKTEHSALEHPK
jgi:hypothetical protein